jgi:hypothetical protein
MGDRGRCARHQLAGVIQSNGTVFAVETLALAELGEGLPPRTIPFGARIFACRDLRQLDKRAGFL